VIVVDTTVLVYAVGTEHKFREPCRSLIQAVSDGAIAATTTVEAIQEFTHVRARRRPRSDAVTLATSYIDLLSPLLVVEEADLREGMRLFASNSRMGSFDSVLAAAATSIGATAIVSADVAFATVPSITHVVPDQEGIARLLQASTPESDPRN
jgi:predicted nucleic acid-binding protein